MVEKSNVPEIRFAGFADPWEQRKLRELVDVRSGRDYQHLEEGPIPVYGTGGYMTGVNEALSYDEDAIGIGRKGTIDKPYRLFAPFWTVDTLFYAVPRENVNLDFALCLFRNVDWKSKDESTGLPSLSKTIINESDVYVPRNPEQRQIGQLFSRLDALITLHQRKYDKLGELKKSLLEKKFPKEGEVFPEIRFAGFADPWEQRKLGELFSYGGSGGTPSSSNDSFYGGKIPFLGISDVKGRDISHTAKHITENGLAASAAWVVPSGAVCLAMYASVGKVGIIRQNTATSQAFFNMVFDNDGTRDFVYSRLERAELTTEWESLISTGTQRNLNANKVRDFMLAVPAETEQRLIGSLFARLDSLITLHQRKLELLRNIKKALLDKMFVEGE